MSACCISDKDSKESLGVTKQGAFEVSSKIDIITIRMNYVELRYEVLYEQESITVASIAYW